MEAMAHRNLDDKNDLPNYNIKIFHSYVQLAEGIIFVSQM